MENEFLRQLSKQLERIEKAVLLRSKDVLTIEECSMLTGMTVGSLYRRTSSGEIPYYKPMGGKIFFKKEEIERWMLRNRQATKEELESEAATRAFLSRGKGVGVKARNA